MCGYCFIVLKVKGKWLNGRRAATKQAAKCTIVATKVGFRLELCSPSGFEHKCICARVCRLTFSPVSDGEVMRRERERERRKEL